VIRGLWHGSMILGMVALLGAAPAPPDAVYAVDPRFGRIGFSVDHLGLFRSSGWFRRFQARIVIDPAHPRRTRIRVDIDARSVDMPWREGAATLRSAEFFDARQYPEVRFRSTSVTERRDGQYVIQGLLAIRGMTRPLALDAVLIARHPGSAGRGEVTDFVATGTLRRSTFGMTADRAFISDRVRLVIHARIRLNAPVPAG